MLIPFASLGWTIVLLLVAQSLTGFANVVYNINQVSLRQAITPERMQGRMNATMRFIVWGTIPIGATIGGIIATAVGVTQAMWIGTILGCTAFLPVFLGPVRGLREFPTAPADGPLREAEMVDGGGGGAPGSATDVMAMAVTGSTPDAIAEAALSGYEPMGISSQVPSRASASRQGRSAEIPAATEVSARAAATARTAEASRAVSRRRVMRPVQRNTGRPSMTRSTHRGRADGADPSRCDPLPATRGPVA